MNFVEIFVSREGEVEKVGGKDEINSRVYGTFKVAGISLTTWQSATVLASTHTRELSTALMASRARPGPGLSFIFSPTGPRTLLMTALRNYCGTSRPLRVQPDTKEDS